MKTLKEKYAESVEERKQALQGVVCSERDKGISDKLDKEDKKAIKPITECEKYAEYMTEGPNTDCHHRIYHFPNDLGASVIYGPGTHGLEVAPISFLDGDYQLDGEPLGYLAKEGLETALDNIYQGELKL